MRGHSMAPIRGSENSGNIPTTTLFVRNLSYGITREELESLFGDIGLVKKVSVVKEKGQPRTETMSRGFAFVKLYDR